MRAPQAIWFGSDEERRKLTFRCGLFALLGWAILEISFQLFLGPHVRLARSAAIGSAIGAAAGLLTSALQWSVLRGYVHYAARLVPATTAGSTVSGLIGGLLLYFLNNSLDLERWAPPIQGATGAAFAGLVMASAQWVVLRNWLAPGRSRRGWIATTAMGSLLGAASACFAAITVPFALDTFLDSQWWPYIVIVANVASGVSGGTVYGRCIARGLRQALPHTAGPNSMVVDERLEVTQAPERARTG